MRIKKREMCVKCVFMFQKWRFAFQKGGKMFDFVTYLDFPRFLFLFLMIFPAFFFGI